MLISCVVAIQGRPGVSRETLKRLASNPYLAVIAVGSSQEDWQTAAGTGAEYMHYPNDLLGAKWQAGVSYAYARHYPDALMILGSDDWVTSDWPFVCYREIRNGADLVGRNLRHILCFDKGQLDLYARKYTNRRQMEPIGTGRIYGRRILDALNWHVFDVERKSSLDGGSYKRMLAAGAMVRLIDDTDQHVLLLKGPWECKHPYKEPINEVEEEQIEDAESWIKKYFPNTRNVIERLRDAAC